MKVSCLSVESVDVVGDEADGLADDEAGPHDGVPDATGQGLGDDCQGQLCDQERESQRIVIIRGGTNTFCG